MPEIQRKIYEADPTIRTGDRPIAPEIPQDGWETLIILQRHGRYDNRRPKDPNHLTKDELSYGRLTNDGKDEVQRIASERIEAALYQDPQNTDILVLNSPTYWLDNLQLGQRAQETAEIVADQVLHKLRESELPEDQLLNHSGRFHGDSTRPHKKLGEALMFQNAEFVQVLRDKHGGQGPDFWEDFNSDAHRKLREELKVEGPTGIADRINLVVNAVARFANGYHDQNPDRKLVVWLVTHGDGLEPYLQRAVQVPAEEFTAGYNDGVGIAIDSQGVAKLEIKGVEYSVPLTAYGTPASVQQD